MRLHGFLELCMDALCAAMPLLADQCERMNLGQLTSTALALCIALLAGCADDSIPAPSAGQVRKAAAVQSNPASAAEGMDRAAKAQNRNLRNGITTRSLTGRAYTFIDMGGVPDGDAASVVRDLSSAALGGEAKASYAIHLKLRECAGMMKRFDKEGASAVRQATYENCRSLSAEHYDSASEWLSLAAEQGHVGAQLLYVSDPEATLGSPADMLRDPDAIKHYKATAMKYLKAASSDGSIDALIHLGDAYRIGVLADQDLVAAYAYYQVAARVEPRFVSSTRMEEIRKRLTPQELQHSHTKGKMIHDECCR